MRRSQLPNDRAAFTIELVEAVYTMPIRARLGQVLLGWDILNDGQPWVPHTRDGWDAILVQLPREFVRALDTGVLDDFLGVSWRGGSSASS